MALPIEGYTVVARLERLQPHMSSSSFTIPNATALFDDHLWRCAFMTLDDANAFVLLLGRLGLDVRRGPECDVVLIDEWDDVRELTANWLRIGRWEKAVIAWREGTRPEAVVAREGWDPKVGSGLLPAGAVASGELTFVEEKDGLSTYVNSRTGKKLYVARSSLSPERRFGDACRTIQPHFVHPGQKKLEGEAKESVTRAVAELRALLDEGSSLVLDEWRVRWFLGKGQAALGELEEAYASFRRAFEIEHEHEAIPRELAGVCLELGKFVEAVTVGRRGVELRPESSESWANLSVAQLLAAELDDAERSVARALVLDASDGVAMTIARILEEVRSGARVQPTTMAELTKPTRPVKKPFWKFWS